MNILRSFIHMLYVSKNLRNLTEAFTNWNHERFSDCHVNEEIYDSKCIALDKYFSFWLDFYLPETLKIDDPGCLVCCVVCTTKVLQWVGSNSQNIKYPTHSLENTKVPYSLTFFLLSQKIYCILKVKSYIP